MMVQLKQTDAEHLHLIYIDFNSMMVQLKLITIERCTKILNRFQFHDGTIKTHRHL